MRRSENDPSIEQEPHLRNGAFQTDPSEVAAESNLRRETTASDLDDQVEHTVWDEPSLSRDLTGELPQGGLTYARWIEKRLAETTTSRSWAVVIGVALAAGPWAILGAFIGGESTFGILMLVAFGPMVEEMMKIAAALWVVEKRPFLFQSRAQIALCALAGGFVFAAIENVLYLKVYVEEPFALLIHWRWSACVALHMGCSLVASMGLMRIWAKSIEQHSRPELSTGLVYILVAIVIHGIYNGFAVLLSLVDFRI